MRRRIHTFLALMAALPLTSFPVAALPFSGGGFEAGGGIPLAPSNASTNVTNSTFGPWTANNLGLTSVNNGDFFAGVIAGSVSPPSDAFEGSQYVTFNGFGAGSGGSISQTFDTVAGQAYTVSFAIAGGDFDGSSQRVAAQITGGSGLLTSRLQNATNNVWTTHSVDFIADASSTTLTFTDALLSGGAAADLLLDNVSVSNATSKPSYADVVLADNPFVYYRFEEAPGSTVAADSAPLGGNQNGAYVGANVTLGTTEAGAPIGLGKAGQFGSSNAFVDVPNLGGNHAQLSVETWINLDGVAAGCCSSILSTDAFAINALGGSLHLNIKDTRSLEFALAGTAGFNSANGLILDNTWYHIVATFDSATGQVNFFLNGDLVASGLLSPTAAGINLSESQITAWLADRNLPGHLDEFALYSSVLSASQVEAHYNAAFQFSAVPVPEPASASLLVLAGFMMARRKQRA